MSLGYSDSDWAEDNDDRKSTSGFVFFMKNIAFTWMSKKQPIFILATCEVEYAVNTSTMCLAIWLRSSLKELGWPQNNATLRGHHQVDDCTSKENSVFHYRSKLICTRFITSEQHREEEVRVVEHVKSQLNKLPTSAPNPSSMKTLSSSEIYSEWRITFKRGCWKNK